MEGGARSASLIARCFTLILMGSLPWFGGSVESLLHIGLFYMYGVRCICLEDYVASKG
jgi:hypothetical protein